MDILKHLDIYGITDRNEGDPSPCLLVYGHGSRLSMPFLRYINNLDGDGEKIAEANHEWNCYIGLPNGTAYWQVGDSSEQNRRFKVNIRQEKEFIRNQHRIYREPIKIERYHVMLMIGLVWNSCFGDINGNRNTILQRGWNPLNRGCSVHPEIKKTRPSHYDSDTGDIPKTDASNTTQNDFAKKDNDVVE